MIITKEFIESVIEDLESITIADNFELDNYTLEKIRSVIGCLECVKDDEF